MSQPVVDTLQLCDALRKTGMEREQAEGLARALGKELGAHVAVQDDVQSGFRQVRSGLGADIQKVRSDLGADIQKVRSDLGADLQQVRSDLTADIQQVRNDLGKDIQQVRSELGADIQQVRSDVQAVDTKVEILRAHMDGFNARLTFMVAGFGLILGVLTVASGMGFFDRTPAPSHAVIESRSP